MTRYALAFLALAAAAAGARGDPFGVPKVADAYLEPTNPNGVWSGSWADLKDVSGMVEIDTALHSERNATMLLPANLWEMVREIGNGNPCQWKIENLDWDHQPNSLVHRIVNGELKHNVKFTAPDGREAVYEISTGTAMRNELMGTRNFEPDYGEHWMKHFLKDMIPHYFDDQYKYVGILYERDPDDPEKIYIVDGQTGKRMTRGQVADFPATISDMMKKRRVPVVNTAPAFDPNPAQPVKTASGTVNLTPLQTTPAKTQPRNPAKSGGADTARKEAATSGAGSKTSGKSPEDTAIEWVLAVANNDLKKAVSLSAPEFAEFTLESGTTGIADQVPVSVRKSDFRVVSVGDGDNGTIAMQIVAERDGRCLVDSEVEVKKYGGVWKVEMGVACGGEYGRSF